MNQRLLNRLIPLAALLAIVVGLIVLLGWAFDIVAMKSILPVWVSMKANTAVCFILIGAGLLPHTYRPDNRSGFSGWRAGIAGFCGLLVGLIGLLTLHEYIFAGDSGIDRLLFAEPAGTVGTSHPGRMAPETALCFVFLAAALLMNCLPLRNRWITIVSAFLGLTVSGQALASLATYLTPQLGAFGWFGFTIMAVHTAVLFATLGWAVAAQNWQQSTETWGLGKGITRVFVSGAFFLMIGGLTVSRTQNWLAYSRGEISQSEKVQFEINNILFNVSRLSSDTRRYITTGDEQFLKSYLSTRVDLDTHVESLRRLEANTSIQQTKAHLLQLRRLVEQQLEWHPQVFGAKISGLSNHSRRDLDRQAADIEAGFKVTSAQLRGEHQQFIETLEQQSKMVSRVSFLAIFAGTSAGIFALIFVLLRLEFVEQQRTEARRSREKSKAQLHLLANNLPNSYIYQFALTSEGAPAFRYVSSGVTQVHGVTPQAVLASANALLDLVSADSLTLLNTTTAQSADNLSTLAITIRCRRTDGSLGWLSLRSSPLRTPEGDIVWDGVATDVTEQHDNEIALRHISARAETLLELPAKAEVMNDRELMQYAMEQAEALTGSQIAFIHLVNNDQETIELVTWSSSTLANFCTAVFDRHYPISQAGIWAEAARTRQAVVFNDYANAENKKGLPEGHSALTRLMSVPVIEDGKVRLMAGVGNKAGDYSNIDVDSVQLIANFVWRLISKRKSELALSIASRVVNASSVVCFRWRAEDGWPVAFVSSNISQWGYEAESLIDGKPPFTEMVHPDDLARVMREVSDYTASGHSPFLQEYRLVTRNGEIRWVIDETIVIRRDDGRVEFYDGVLSDITERKLTEQSLTHSLNEQRVLNKKLEEAHNQLLQSEKMASIGQLAAGVAHELNNPIGFVNSNLGTLDGYLHDLLFILDSYDKEIGSGNLADDLEGARSRINEICKDRDFDFVRNDIFQLITESRDGIDRVRRIVLDLKTFSRAGVQEADYADLNQGLESTLNIVWNELKYKCKVIKELGELPPVYCQGSQINQVFLNLLVNAGQAIETQGEITLRTRLADEGQSVVIEVSDTGKGIPPENLSRIFDPFFTTKPVGKGTGLGLSLSYSIVQAHHGRIEVESKPGQGTTFRVILPIEKQQALPE
jgi:PAS domain S-box-containing protein